MITFISGLLKLKPLTEPQPGDRCLICGAPPTIIGIFTPEDSVKWGTPIGKTRFLRYCLCSKCQGRPQTSKDVEKIIRAELFGGVTHAE